jgi:hypothetical protein
MAKKIVSSKLGPAEICQHLRYAQSLDPLVSGTLGTLDRIGVLAQHSGDEGKQWRWVNALV